jgi:quinol monooxygenase YgiN
VAGAKDGVGLTLVSLVFDASDPDTVAAVLAKYVVVSRGAPGCRNIDLSASMSRPGRFVVTEKWDSPEAQRTHFDSPEMIEMAEACRGLLTRPPEVDLLDPISAHDLH